MFDSEALRAALETECGELTRFIATLTEEQAVLVAADPERLPAASEAKLRSVTSLNAETTRRNAVLTGLGLPPDRAGLDAAATRWPALAEQVKRLRQLASAATEQNRINGRLIATQLQGTRDALQALGVGPGEEDRLYAADARAQDAARRTGVRIIDSA